MAVRAPRPDLAVHRGLDLLLALRLGVLLGPEEEVDRAGREEHSDDAEHQAMRQQVEQAAGDHGDGHVHRERGGDADPHPEGPIARPEDERGEQALVRELGDEGDGKDRQEHRGTHRARA